MGRKRSRKNRHLPPRMHFKNGSYYLVHWNGTRRVWTWLGRTYAVAMVKYCQLERLAERPRSGRTFKDLADEYRLTELPKKAERTQEEYTRALANLLATFGAAQVDQIRPAHIGQYMDLRSSINSANKEKAVMSAMFELGIRWGWLEDNPARKIKYHPTTRRRRIISPAEWSALQLIAPNDLIPVFMDLLYSTGLRVGDVLKIRFGQITPDGIMIDQGKNKVAGLYELTDTLAAIVERCRKLHTRRGQTIVTKLIRPSTPLIHTRRMAPYTYSGIRSIWRRVVARAGIEDVRIHDIRRTAITRAKQEGRRPQDFSLHRTEAEAAAYVIEIPRVRPLDPLA